MEAKDTVISLNQMAIEEEKQLPDMVSFNNIAELQAEITWDVAYKAGKLEGVVLYSTWLRGVIVDGKNESIKAKLKEWGL